MRRPAPSRGFCVDARGGCATCARPDAALRVAWWLAGPACLAAPPRGRFSFFLSFHRWARGDQLTATRTPPQEKNRRVSTAREPRPPCPAGERPADGNRAPSCELRRADARLGEGPARCRRRGASTAPAVWAEGDRRGGAASPDYRSTDHARRAYSILIVFLFWRGRQRSRDRRCACNNHNATRPDRAGGALLEYRHGGPCARRAPLRVVLRRSSH